MLSQRTIEKRVQEELGRDERWRVIVRGNNWLCPYCLKIGARELRMDEAIEEKIAGHFVSACRGWDYFNAEPHPIDRLRQTARFLVFKGRIARWIAEDRRYQLTDDEQRWLCPYCAEATQAVAPERGLDAPGALGDHPEEGAFVTQVAGHLLKCPGFQEGEDQLRPVRELEERQARRSRRNRLARVKRRFEREASFRLMDADKRWLCPFCAVPQDLPASDRPGDAFFQGLADHLAMCKAYEVLEGKPRPVDELRAKIQAGARARQLDKLRGKVERHAIWRVRDLEGRWYCPYCGDPPGSVFYPKRQPDGSKEPAAQERFVGGVLEHLGTCDEYRRPKAKIRSRAEMAAAVQQANLQIDRHRRVRKALLEDPLWGVTDGFSNWLCPYCRRVNKQIHIADLRESTVFEKTVEQVVDHLHEACESFREDAAPKATLAELKAVVSKADLLASGIRESGSGVRLISTDSMDETSWQRIKEDLQVVKTRVERARQRESMLKEARSKQLRLLPDVPDLPGYEFARVYRPCDAVGGDFYAFFQAAGGLQAVAIGDISGHGIEAALLMGLAKKLVEVHGRTCPSTAQTLSLANRDIFSDLDERTFVTVFFGLLDPETRRFKFSRAGHDPLILYNPRRNPALSILDSKGMALGMDEGPVFEGTIEELEVALQPGDLVLQYTDGVTETMNARNEQFGHERLYRVIEEHGRHEAEYVLWKIDRAIAEFRGERRRADDQTMLAFKVLPEAGR